ncbi:N-alpha-acetyltransferase 25, NatB auxiliary subunit isoform X2 [Nematostella vectensis]|uniref:N-alpha-acetyltransferase 25, NatB auxiliary subunit isoform X2 n=1 Tax=Nematostella vectensis TaxID=45351 RepID=UPI0020772E75|nr:N-alpha-acetyltransferase 25, NatB auxiliary subunit isoform X2 [Nematostella vectensis]
MASRLVDVNERRLRPVYDALDSLKNKQAIQLVDKILKKQKDLHCAKALKALALWRSGKPEECKLLMDELCADKPTDEPTLQAMSICFKEMQKPEGIVTIYETAVKHSPTNEEFLSHLFMAYVRVADYKKQPQAAMNLYKVSSKNPYYFWAVMSYVMQALSCKDKKLSQGMLLPLAERMVEKFAKEGKIKEETEVQLYLMILEALEKYEKALDMLDGPLAEKLVSDANIREEKRGEYLTKLERWAEANIVYKNLVEKVNMPDSSIDMLDNMLRSLVETEKLKGKIALRGPFLAQLELEKLIQENHVKAGTRNDVMPLVDLHIAYFERFGDKHCCFQDLAPYIYLLDADEREQFVDAIKNSLSEVQEDDTKSAKVKHLLRKLCVEQISRYIGRHCGLSDDEKIQQARNYMEMHKEGLKYGQDLESTELQYSDGFALLAAHLLLDVNENKGSKNMTWHVLILLETALKASPSNHNMKLLLLRMYSSLGAFGPCKSLFQSMEIKHIGLDTLGYLTTRIVHFLGHFESAQSIYCATLKHFFANQKDTPEYIIAAYRNGSFEKVPEFTSFKDRLNSSLQFSSVSFEKTMLDVLQSPASLPDYQLKCSDLNLLEQCPLNKNWLSELKDNRDLAIYPSWDPPERRFTKEQAKYSFENEVFWIRYRCIALRGLGLAVSLIPKASAQNYAHPDSGNAMVNGEASPRHLLQETIQAMETLLGEINENPARRSKTPFLGPPPDRLTSMLDGNHGNVLLAMLRVCHWSHGVHEDCSEIQECSAKQISDGVNFTADMLKANTATCISQLTVNDGDNTRFNGAMLEPIVHLVEGISHLGVLSSVSCSLLHKVTTTKKAKKKKTIPAHVVELRESLRGFLETLKTCSSDLHSSLMDVQAKQLAQEMLELNLSHVDKEVMSSTAPEIWCKIQSSFQQSLKEITDLLHSKVVFIKSLHL